MSLDIDQIALHQLIKRDEQNLELVLRESLLEPTATVVEMMAELHRVYSAKNKAYGLFNEESELAQALRNMHSAISDSLDDDGFLFQLYLPEGDAVSVFDRADALAGWVNHFLLGLGVSQPKLDKVKDETGEAIDDLRNIAQLGYDEDEDQEELEMSLEEIIEYVRVAALLCHDTFARQQPTAPEVRKPTLH